MRLADGTELDLENRSIVQNEEVSLYFSEIRARPERQALRARLEKPEKQERPALLAAEAAAEISPIRSLCRFTC